jgi:hypothetical protein
MPRNLHRYVTRVQSARMLTVALYYLGTELWKKVGYLSSDVFGALEYPMRVDRVTIDLFITFGLLLRLPQRVCSGNGWVITRYDASDAGGI